jgi:hypothetical protein
LTCLPGEPSGEAYAQAVARAKARYVLMAVDQPTTLAGRGWTTPRFRDSGEWCSQRCGLICRRAPHPVFAVFGFGLIDFRGDVPMPCVVQP